MKDPASCGMASVRPAACLRTVPKKSGACGRCAPSYS